MMTKSPPLHGVQKTVLILLLFFLGIAALIFAKPFLVPVLLAGLFAMLFLPLASRLEKAGVNRALASLFCLLIFVLIIAAILGLVYWQINSLVADIGNVQAKLQSLISTISEYIDRTFGITREQQEKVIDQQTEKASGGITDIGGMIMNVIVHTLLVLVYVFLFLYYRGRIKNFILKIVPKREDGNTESAIDDIKRVSHQYLTGIGMMILTLWIMYGIAFSIIGLKHALLFAILCGLLELVPYVGNFTGNLLAAIMAVTQGGGTGMVIGILITYALIQFIQTYIIEPLVVGTEVNINPLFTIIGLILGELIWGISGLVLAIPLLAFVKIICDHIPSLQPYGYLLGRDKTESFIGRMKNMFSKN